jgi:hypothetical protein
MARNRPRNQRYLQGVVVGIRRPLRLYGRAEHRRQVAPQRDLKCLAGWVWREHDGVHETAQGLRGLRLSGSWRAFASSVTFVRWIRVISGCRSGGASVATSLASSCSRLPAFAFSSSFITEGRHVFHHHLDQLLAAGLNAFDLTLRSRETGSMLHSQPVHLARELFTELVKQILAQRRRAPSR